ncbi:MAG: DUF3795 domain-containing protein [Candidatus Lokiarchaeota archaeon]|nr:DUF3795 domain-containing protein [Candidatus Lokiarchaeota archaeon]
MEENIVYCGLDCAKCPIYVATRNNDEDLRKKTAERWNLDINELYCNMCNTEEGKLPFFCQKCTIRLCARERNFITCAECSYYPCEKLVEPFEKYPMQKQTLDAIRKKLL